VKADRYVGIGAVALGVALYAMAGESEAYLFPRLIALAIGLLGLAVLGSALATAQAGSASASASARGWASVLPALAILVAYRWAMEIVGFYTAAFAVFLTIVWVYAPEPVTLRLAARRVVVSAVFVGTIYAIFALLLRVQTPRGLLL
jgi:hypothetical protein